MKYQFEIPLSNHWNACPVRLVGREFNVPSQGSRAPFPIEFVFSRTFMPNAYSPKRMLNTFCFIFIPYSLINFLCFLLLVMSNCVLWHSKLIHICL